VIADSNKISYKTYWSAK